MNATQFYFEHEYALFVYPEDQLLKINLENPSQELTSSIQNSINSIIKAESYTYKEELASQAASWDGEKRFISKHSNTLLQLNNPVQISPNPQLWKCENCDKTNNLWLCLTDGKRKTLKSTLKKLIYNPKKKHFRKNTLWSTSIGRLGWK